MYYQIWNTVTSGREWHGEFLSRKKNGDPFWEAASISAIYNDYGNVTNFVAISVDITDRKRVERVLEENELQYRILLNTVTDFIIRTDILFNIIYVNESFLSQLIPEKQILGENIMSFILPEDRQRVLEDIDLSFKQKVGLRECKIKFGNEEVDCEVNGDVLRDSDGQPSGMVFVLRDISRRKNAEKELEKYRLHLEELIAERTHELGEVNKLLEEKITKQKHVEEKIRQSLAKEREFSELKSKFASMASHELRTPLAVIFSSIELIQRYRKKWNEQEFNEQVEKIKKYIHHITDIIDDMLIISRTETGKIKFEPKETDLKQLCLSILGDLSLLRRNDYDLKFNYRLKKKNFPVDEKLLKYILMNLLSNAIKYTIHGGSIEFNITMIGEKIDFEIVDNGIGIPEKDQTYLFEPFHRGENVGEIQGTGLGMSIVKRSVEMHKGTISFESKLNKGTKFKIGIPTN
jgi:PAS domain S-box-containing protein